LSATSELGGDEIAAGHAGLDRPDRLGQELDPLDQLGRAEHVVRDLGPHARARDHPGGVAVPVDENVDLAVGAVLAGHPVLQLARLGLGLDRLDDLAVGGPADLLHLLAVGRGEG
jgi:hypothetical protein